jgi:hypothetical protein
MKNLRFLALVLAFAVLAAPGAFALSTEQSPINSDGTPKFADPDDQTPPGLVSSDGHSSGVTMNLSGSSSPVNLPTPGQAMGMDQGQSAFDHAYGHVTNQNQ